MSDNWIIVIPETVDFVPSEDVQRRAVELFRRLAPTAHDVKAEASANVQFISCGANFERVACPACGAVLNTRWWSDRMQEEYEANHSFLKIEMPCCHAKQSINELKYEWPQGFARFRVEAKNPGISDLSAEHLNEFELLLGCRVRKIHCHI